MIYTVNHSFCVICTQGILKPPIGSILSTTTVFVGIPMFTNFTVYIPKDEIARYAVHNVLFFVSLVVALFY